MAGKRQTLYLPVYSAWALIVAVKVLAMLMDKELSSPEWAERLLPWRHSGFNVHNLVRTETKGEASVWAARPVYRGRRRV